MSDANVHVGRCLCGAVELAVTGEPAVVGVGGVVARIQLVAPEAVPE